MLIHYYYYYYMIYIAPISRIESEALTVCTFSPSSSPLYSDRQHLSCDVCLEVREEINKTVVCGIVY